MAQGDQNTGGFSMKRILVVDDEIGALTLIGIMLERGGFEVLKAKDADQALSVLDLETPDLIILDVMMPGMDGIELCRVLRQRPDTAELPVLILSARGDAKSVMSGMDAGASDYLPKPILHHDLVAKVRRMLDLDPAVADS
jgi:DNA-binding response OmpR family regulator